MKTNRDSQHQSRTGVISLLRIKPVCFGLLFFSTVVSGGEDKTVSQDGVSLDYDTAMFSKVEIVESSKEPLPHPHDQLNVHPATLKFLFSTGSHCAGVIILYPLEDQSVDDLNTAYPELLPREKKLVHLLHDRPIIPQRYPDGTPKEIPTIQNQRSAQYFLSHVRYLDFAWGSGIGFLVQYSQDASEYAVGSRLNYQIEAVTANRTTAMSAYFDIGHPDLPRTEKDEIVTDGHGEDLGEDAYLRYLRRMEQFLDAKDETTFRPSLNSIQKLVGSLRFENVEPVEWGSTFTGETRAVESPNVSKKKAVEGH